MLNIGLISVSSKWLHFQTQSSRSCFHSMSIHYPLIMERKQTKTSCSLEDNIASAMSFKNQEYWFICKHRKSKLWPPSKINKQNHWTAFSCNKSMTAQSCEIISQVCQQQSSYLQAGCMKNKQHWVILHIKCPANHQIYAGGNTSHQITRKILIHCCMVEEDWEKNEAERTEQAESLAVGKAKLYYYLLVLWA